jgi:hypothetical protein
MIPRGLRNFNPGNLRVGEPWRGLAEVCEMDDDQLAETDFCVFISPIYGIRALAKLLIGYQKRHNLYTVRGIIDRYAPPVENDTGSYVANVADCMAVGRHEHIDLSDPLTLHLMIDAIITHENGYNPYQYYEISDGMVLAAL